MGLMGFAVAKSKGTDKGRPRKPNPLVNHLMIQYFNRSGFFWPSNSNLNSFFHLKRLFNAPEFGKFVSPPLSAFSPFIFSTSFPLVSRHIYLNFHQA